MTERKSWTVKDEDMLYELIKLVNLTPAEKEILLNLQTQAQAIAPALSEAFYQRLLAHPLTVEFVDGQIGERKKMLEQWFIELFLGNYGTDYVQRRLRIGEVHVKVGLPVRYPLAMMDLVLECGLKIAAESSQPVEAAQAFRKLLALDMAVFNQAYENIQLRHLAETMGNERLARRLLQQQ